VTENFCATQAALNLSLDDVYTIARNGFTAAFLNPAEKGRYLAMLDAHRLCAPRG